MLMKLDVEAFGIWNFGILSDPKDAPSKMVQKLSNIHFRSFTHSQIYLMENLNFLAFLLEVGPFKRLRGPNKSFPRYDT